MIRGGKKWWDKVGNDGLTTKAVNEVVVFEGWCERDQWYSSTIDSNNNNDIY